MFFLSFFFVAEHFTLLKKSRHLASERCAYLDTARDMRLLRCAVVVLFMLLGVARADEAAADAQDVAAPEVLPNFSKMRIRELQAC